MTHSMHTINTYHVQAQASLDEEPDATNSNRRFTRQDSASSSAVPGKEAAAGFKGAFKKVANGIAGA